MKDFRDTGMLEGCNHRHNILQLCNILENFGFITSEAVVDINCNSLEFQNSLTYSYS